MINLLPPSEKKKLQKEFRLRYGIVTLLSVFLLELLTIVGIVPSYLSLNTSTNALSQSLAQKKSLTPPETTATQNDLNTIKNEITLLKHSGIKDTPPSDVMSLLLGQKPSGVSITRFSYARSDSGVSAQLSGNANTSEDLLLFRRLLKANEHIKDARYAQSFITKKTDIDFLLTVDLK